MAVVSLLIGVVLTVAFMGTPLLLLALLAVLGLTWGLWWGVSGGMTVASMAAPPRARGMATGLGYAIVDLAALALLLVMANVPGRWWPGIDSQLKIAATVVALVTLIGWLSAAFILPDDDRYVEQESAGPT